ncbi:hypothetical protein ACWDTP_31020 [Mycobacterium sp. NPDC003449]
MRDFFQIIFIAAIAVAVIQQFFDHSRSSQRRIYWSSTCVGAIAAFLTLYPDVGKGLLVGLAIFAAMGIAAYGYTPYIKIRGKIYALTAQDSDPDPEGKPIENAVDDEDHTEHDPAPDAYSGLLTARKMWWMVAVLMLIAAINLRIFIESGCEDWGPGIIGAGFLVFFGIGLGIGDASWGYRIAREQYVQFAIVSIITVGTFAVLYLVAYSLAKIKPLRRKGSMEYRAHPRHRRPVD